LNHTADVKVLAEGQSIEGAFSSSALAVRELICGKIKIKPKIIKKFSVKAKDLEGLLYNFLEEFLFLLDAKGFILSRVSKLKIIESGSDFKLVCEVLGDKTRNYKFSNSVKAITYNEMFVGKKGKSFICRFVLDV
jgi:SHS2 domain-containing protein